MMQYDFQCAAGCCCIGVQYSSGRGALGATACACQVCLGVSPASPGQGGRAGLSRSVLPGGSSRAVAFGVARGFVNAGSKGVSASPGGWPTRGGAVCSGDGA